MGYDEPEKPGVKHVYVRSFEPLKFIKNIKSAVSSAVAQGFSVTLSLGGPEKFPTNVYRNRAGGAIFFIYLIMYWTKMKIEVEGKPDDENSKKAGEIEAALDYQAEEHT